MHAHITYHGRATLQGRTVRDRAMSPDMARDTAEYAVRDLIARPDGTLSPAALALRGNDCTSCTAGDPRGTVTYGYALVDLAGATVGAVHVNLCPVRHA